MLEECDYTCEAHGGVVCRDNETENAAAMRLCDECMGLLAAWVAEGWAS